jgi:hypothetical protein
VPNSVLHPSINWLPDFPIDATQLDRQRALLDGDYDETIDVLADWCALQPRPILARLGYEFDRIPPHYYDRALFADSFRHVVDRFRSKRVINVAWVWASANFLPFTRDRLSDENFDDWYPSDGYVDWLGYSMWYPNLPDPVIMRHARARDKPVMLAETTSSTFNISTLQQFPYGAPPSIDLTPDELWDGWWTPMIRFIEANADVIAAWHYISADWSGSPFSVIPLFSNCDSRIWRNPIILERWQEAIQKRPFLTGRSGLFSTLALG